MRVATLWKNGVATTLSNGLFNANAVSVHVSGNDVYTIGKDGGNVALWKNNLPPVGLSSPSSAGSVFVSGDDVYIGGTLSNTATIWKNGVATNFTNGANSGVSNVFVTKN